MTCERLSVVSVLRDSGWVQSPGTHQRKRQRVVALVTSVLEHVLVRATEACLASPRLRVVTRIRHRENVAELVRGDTSDPLCHGRVWPDEEQHAWAGTRGAGRREVLRLDHQRLAFPP